MIHIIRNLGAIGVTADRLRDVANDTRRGVNPQQRISILEEVLRVRKLEERLERQEVGAYFEPYSTVQVSSIYMNFSITNWRF
jgi:hypothetical protein